MPDQAPLVHTITSDAAAAAAGATGALVIGASPFDATVTAVTYVPLAAIVGADTNTRTLAVINKGTDASKSTSVASLPLAAAVGTVPALREKTITLSATPANLIVLSGEVLELTSTPSGTGLADPGGEIRVTLSRS